ncbi:MAG TPA: twin-arginine translocation signal domain-containing protein, partial [Gemmataceae bacterium]|nr:twin-arginine translocation signal domain-containing protein [Gemmataceae bacterium]
MTHPSSRLDRRRFLQLGATAAAGLAAAPGLGFAAEDDPFGGFKVGAQTYTFRHFDLEQTLKHMDDLGLRYAEFYQKHVPA